MATAFMRQGRPARLTAHLEPGERSLIASVFSDTIALLGSGRDEGPQDEFSRIVGISENTAPPSDPALARLLPDAAPDDPERAAEFRRYTEAGLRDAKIARLKTALLTLRRTDPLRLAEPEAQAWLAALTDVRLVLASRMGIEDEDDVRQLAERAGRDRHGRRGDDSDSMIFAVYEFLTWLQETLAEALLEGLEEDTAVEDEDTHRPGGAAGAAGPDLGSADAGDGGGGRGTDEEDI